MGYDLIPKKKGVDCKSGMIFTWPVILNETGACYLFGYGDHTFSPGKYIYVGSRKEGATCPQCKGSGRVIVSCEVTTYVSAYVPEND